VVYFQGNQEEVWD